MSCEVYLRPDAEQDVEDASLWYDSQRKGLGGQFLDEISRTLNAISEYPASFPIVHRNIRRALTRSFPFGIYYRVEEELAVVVAVLHASRDPRRWKQRA